MAKEEPWNFQSLNFKDSKNPYPICIPRPGCRDWAGVYFKLSPANHSFFGGRHDLRVAANSVISYLTLTVDIIAWLGNCVNGGFITMCEGTQR
jgi:hypothetical protein